VRMTESSFFLPGCISAGAVADGAVAGGVVAAIFVLAIIAGVVAVVLMSKKAVKKLIKTGGSTGLPTSDAAAKKKAARAYVVQTSQIAM
jgi:hypothetical protein